MILSELLGTAETETVWAVCLLTVYVVIRKRSAVASVEAAAAVTLALLGILFIEILVVFVGIIPRG